MSNENELDISTLSSLARKLAIAKTVEEKAKAGRIELEEKIAKLVDGPERGSRTVTTEDGVKVTVERGFNYKAEIDKIFDLFIQGEPQEGKIVGFAPVKVKTTKELDVNGYEYYKDNQPEVFSKIAKFVTATPKKIAVSLKASK
ncbi:MAG: hypothetical protein WC919_07785 [Candidatus Paceibacterota bacterium]|jgi:hypothetical protein